MRGSIIGLTIKLLEAGENPALCRNGKRQKRKSDTASNPKRFRAGAGKNDIVFLPR